MITPTDKNAWPVLSWEIPKKDALPWFQKRMHDLAVRSRAFELAVEQGAEKGEVELALIEEELGEWDGYTETVFMYAGLCRDGDVEADSVPFYVEEVELVFSELRELREKIYGKLGPKSVRIRQVEAATKVTDEQIAERIVAPDDGDESVEGDFTDGELPEGIEPEDGNADGASDEDVASTLDDEDLEDESDEDLSLDDLGFEEDADADLAEEVPSMPVSVDELRMRQAAESKLLPAKLEVVDLLAHLPSEWVIAIFQTLDLEEDEDNEPSIRSPKATRYRAMLGEVLRDPEKLEEIVDNVGDAACSLLRDVIAKKGMMDYRSVIEKYGADDADGFFWTERAPASALSRLRRTGLVYVGGFRGCAVVTIPTDLIPKLTPLLRKAG